MQRWVRVYKILTPSPFDFYRSSTAHTHARPSTHVLRRGFARETRNPYDPPPDAPSKSGRNAVVIGTVGLGGLAYLFSMERNDYGISWYADGTSDESKLPVTRPKD